MRYGIRLEVCCTSIDGYDIDVTDRLRLLGNLELDTSLSTTFGASYTYEWSELSGRLTSEEIENIQFTNGDSQNLVLESNSLSEGVTYQFHLKITNTISNAIGGASINIYVKQGPIIVFNSIGILPTCNRIYNSLSESLMYRYELFIKADGDYKPLSYQFGYNDNFFNLHQLLHSQSIYSNQINDIILPLGNVEIEIRVLDTNGNAKNDIIACSSSLVNDISQESCFNFQTDIIENYQTTYIETLTDVQFVRFIFHSTQALLQ